MAEHSKGGIFTRAQKTLTRTKAKVLQNLGKAEKTSDEKLDEHVHRLDKQQEAAHKLQKELRTYINAARAMQNASRSLHSTIQETYESDWPGGEKIQENLQSIELMWSDYLQKMQERVQEPLATYVSHILPLKTRIAKRGRKLVDYDNARHNLDVVQNAKKKDENKIAKAKDDAEQARQIYTDMNNFLHEDLPEFNKSRVNLYGATFENLYSSESMFHLELGKLSEELGGVAKQLASQNEFSYRPRPISKMISHEIPDVNGESGDHTNGNSGYESSSPVATPTRPSQPPMVNGHEVDEGHGTPPASPLYANSATFQDCVAESPPPAEEASPSVKESQPPETEDQLPQAQEDEAEETKASEEATPPTTEATPPPQETPDQIPVDDAPDYPPPAIPNNPPPEAITPSEPPVMPMKEEETLPVEEVETKPETPETKPETPETKLSEPETKPSEPETKPSEPEVPAPVYDVPPPERETEDSSKFNDDNVYEVPTSNAPVEEKLPEDVLYKVVTTHFYKKEDDDELSFEKGDIIYVMKYKGAEDLDDGWLMGMLKSTGVKGVFPGNFTKRDI